MGPCIKKRARRPALFELPEVLLALACSKVRRRHGIRRRPNVRLTGETQAASKAEAETHDQVAELLRILWREVWSGLPSCASAAGLARMASLLKRRRTSVYENVVGLPISRDDIAASASTLCPRKA